MTSSSNQPLKLPAAGDLGGDPAERNPPRRPDTTPGISRKQLKTGSVTQAPTPRFPYLIGNVLVYVVCPPLPGCASSSSRWVESRNQVRHSSSLIIAHATQPAQPGFAASLAGQSRFDSANCISSALSPYLLGLVGSRLLLLGQLAHLFAGGLEGGPVGALDHRVTVRGYAFAVLEE